MNTYIPALTGIRAIAAFMVFFHHYQFAAWPVLTELHIGVSLFFTLSGFLIYSRYATGVSMTGAWWWRYLRNRIARVYPMYFLLTCISFAYTALSTGVVDWWVFSLNITFLRGFSEEYRLTGIAPGWSLTVEECFYISAPLLFILFRRRGFKSGFWIGLASIYAVGILLWRIGESVQIHSFFAPFRLVAVYTFFGRAFEFFIGMAAAYLLKHRTARSRSTGGVASWIGTAGIGAVALMMTQFQAPGMYGLYHPAGMILNHFVLPLFSGALLWGLTCEKTMLSAILGSPVMVLLGKSSYIFYLVHMMFFAGMFGEWLYPAHLNLLPMILALFVVMNILSIALFFFVEDPLNRLLRGTAPSFNSTH
jgi:peptidoglycan/LPS O-acetylase OafA/YrhL